MYPSLGQTFCITCPFPLRQLEFDPTQGRLAVRTFISTEVMHLKCREGVLFVQGSYNTS